MNNTYHEFYIVDLYYEHMFSVDNGALEGRLHQLKALSSPLLTPYEPFTFNCKFISPLMLCPLNPSVELGFYDDCQLDVKLLHHACTIYLYPNIRNVDVYAKQTIRTNRGIMDGAF